MLCAGTSSTLVETHEEVLHQNWFELELVEGFLPDRWFSD
jgi:hypothetical protein